MALTAYFVGGSRDGQNESILNESVEFDGYTRFLRSHSNSKSTSVIYCDNNLNLDERGHLVTERALRGQFNSP
ncbi:hypothetical protein [Janthinobacterium sp. B9-8]|uniref:hypothetical protein n=1 Tax=Janthinobacterium sp. B9-8 TaxID=1236179 RepID=UPI000A7A02FC|nr:hypothetical protein [Janthinobacterium sp. B9-8]